MVTKTENLKTSAPTRDNSQAHARQVAPIGPVAEMMGLHESVGNRAMRQVLQAKLTINQPGDKYEQEADRIAEMVMRMPEPNAVNGLSYIGQGVQRKCAACASGGNKCSKCHEEEEKIQRKPLAATITPLMQRNASNAATPVITPQIASQINSLRGGGQPLSESSRAFFEPRFGVDFSGVRVHTGSEAAQTAHSLNARAFTIGQDVVFGTGQYAPNRDGGRRLMAHELTHVVQQQGLIQLQRQEISLDEARAHLESSRRAQQKREWREKTVEYQQKFWSGLFTETLTEAEKQTTLWGARQPNWIRIFNDCKQKLVGYPMRHDHPGFEDSDSAWSLHNLCENARQFVLGAQIIEERKVEQATRKIQENLIVRLRNDLLELLEQYRSQNPSAKDLPDKIPYPYFIAEKKQCFINVLISISDPSSSALPVSIEEYSANRKEYAQKLFNRIRYKAAEMRKSTKERSQDDIPQKPKGDVPQKPVEDDDDKPWWVVPIILLPLLEVVSGPKTAPIPVGPPLPKPEAPAEKEKEDESKAKCKCSLPTDIAPGLPIYFPDIMPERDRLGTVIGFKEHPWPTCWLLSYKIRNFSTYKSRSLRFFADESCKLQHKYIIPGSCNNMNYDLSTGKDVPARITNGVNIPRRRKADYVKLHPLCWSMYQPPEVDLVGLDRINGEKTSWVRTHLISGSLGGPGRTALNLVPTPASVNNPEIYNKYEKDLVQLVITGRSVSKYYWFHANVSYYEQDNNSEIGHPEDFVKEIFIEYGLVNPTTFQPGVRMRTETIKVEMPKPGELKPNRREG